MRLSNNPHKARNRIRKPAYRSSPRYERNRIIRHRADGVICGMRRLFRLPPAAASHPTAPIRRPPAGLRQIGFGYCPPLGRAIRLRSLPPEAAGKLRYCSLREQYAQPAELLRCAQYARLFRFFAPLRRRISFVRDNNTSIHFSDYFISLQSCGASDGEAANPNSKRQDFNSSAFLSISLTNPTSGCRNKK